MKQRIDIRDLFESKSVLNVCAPMVRYSKLQFRSLVRQHNVDLCFTPMILANSFCRSVYARDSEFSTNTFDGPLVVQFAANTAYDFAAGAEMVYPYADGVDLNCGCPQRWAIQEGLGCGLLAQPEAIQRFIRAVRSRLPTTFSVSVKVRLLPTLAESVELCRQLEHCGATFLTVHGRTPTQRGDPVDISAIAEIKKSIQIPLVANGDIKSVEDAQIMHKLTRCNGVMAARGILTNPAMFDGVVNTPLQVVQQWSDLCIAAEERISFQCVHHHLVFMLEKILPKTQRLLFNNLTTKTEVFEFLESELDTCIDGPLRVQDDIQCHFDVDTYKTIKSEFGVPDICKKCLFEKDYCICEQDNFNYDRNGKFFTDKVSKEKQMCDLDFMESSMFDIV